MSSSAKQLYDTAMQLSDSDRADLAAWLIESLDPATDSDIDAAWDVEISRRVEELDSGKVAALPWPEARRMILGLVDGPSTD